MRYVFALEYCKTHTQKSENGRHVTMTEFTQPKEKKKKDSRGRVPLPYVIAVPTSFILSHYYVYPNGLQILT